MPNQYPEEKRNFQPSLESWHIGSCPSLPLYETLLQGKKGNVGQA